MDVSKPAVYDDLADHQADCRYGIDQQLTMSVDAFKERRLRTLQTRSRAFLIGASTGEFAQGVASGPGPLR